MMRAQPLFCAAARARKQNRARAYPASPVPLLSPLSAAHPLLIPCPSPLSAPRGYERRVSEHPADGNGNNQANSKQTTRDPSALGFVKEVLATKDRFRKRVVAAAGY